MSLGLAKISARRHECPSCLIHVHDEANVCVNCGRPLGRLRIGAASAAPWPHLLLAPGSVASRRILRG
jgi:hypothetical protein